MNIEDLLIRKDRTVKQAVKKIDTAGRRIVFVVDEDNRLVGSFTDGDMRRYLLKNGDFDNPVSEAMWTNPTAFQVNEEEKAKQYIEDTGLIAIPVIDDSRHVVCAHFRSDVIEGEFCHKALDGIPVVIMAGGRGTRLYPYTKILPKPLIPIGEYPITELIMNRFHDYGANEFYLVLNHKKNMVKTYFNEAQLPYYINYVDEEQFLGTGGGLSLLKGKINSTIIVSNCDCLIDTDYSCMYDYHRNHRNVLTMICAMKNFIIPYGVIEMDGTGGIQTMQEKPEFSYLVNTGIYVIEPTVIESLEYNRYIDLPQIAVELKNKGEKVGVYPITESSWLDMGQIAEMKKMMRHLDVEE